METFDGRDVHFFESVDRLDAWLAENHAVVTEAWLKLAKKSSGIRSVSPAEVIDVALCYGWIDGQRRSLDDSHYLQRITPRRHKSQWSQVNVDKVEALTAAGRMKEPGLAEVAAAKGDGRWDAAYASQKTAVVPSDLAGALARSDPARTRFEQLGKTDRYAVILRLLRARTPENRAARLRAAIIELEAADQPR
ncbi:YdeI/OmpD-associated family protein [Streptomyces albipurpureus]|uniref:YdeI/OmpD-associated family protein n=1 Tax=Streptomyces albipurpureus TaxID=2897419 RepID=A0ABT0UN15_9ACTN|nr:YdeI/OmpD-associated family protein [Streptomyces sp. CWNU-1]MCM2389850.1 YdeI/OmpD-associated family protein [Streptomyces sp. CWNU-1]